MNEIIPLSEREALYFIQDMDTIGNATLCKLNNKFGSFLNAYNATEEELMDVLKPDMLKQFTSRRNTINPKELYKRLLKRGVRHILITDEEYPERLKEIPDAPPAIFVKNELPKDDIPSVAIIGSRGCSEYGRMAAMEYTRVLTKYGIQIISGLAMGIDGIAQNTAYREGGRTFAVLGCGVDVCYPQSNRDIFDKLSSDRGGLISEYTLGTPGKAWHFPMRNRIISALSDAVIVIEARKKSGTLITVDAALEQGRDVYALPGRVFDSLSCGCNELIKQGAQILTHPDDFITDFFDSIKNKPRFENYVNRYSKHENNKQKVIFASEEEQIIYECMDFLPMTADQIFESVNLKINMNLASLLEWLANMTLSGLIFNMGRGYYVKKM